MRIVLLALLAVSLLEPLAHPTRAEASCMGPTAGLSPRAGTPMPAKGTLYLFSPRLGFELPSERDPAEASKRTKEPGITVEGAASSVRVVAETPFYVVAQITYEARAEKIQVRLPHQQEVLAAYPIAPPAAPNHARVVDVDRSRSSWTCSHTNTINIHLEGNAIAYRVEWVDGTTTIVPSDNRTFLSYWSANLAGDPEDTPRQLVELGHLNCKGHNVEPAAFATLRSFRLFALYADGSEQVFRLASAMLTDDDVRLPFELLEADARPRAAAEGTQLTAEVLVLEQPSWRRSLLGGLLGGAALLSMVLVGVLWRRLSHRRREHIPRY